MLHLGTGASAINPCGSYAQDATKLQSEQCWRLLQPSLCGEHISLLTQSGWSAHFSHLSNLRFLFLCLLWYRSNLLLLGLFLAYLLSQTELTFLPKFQIPLTLVLHLSEEFSGMLFLILCTHKINVCMVSNPKISFYFKSDHKVTASPKSLLIYKVFSYSSDTILFTESEKIVLFYFLFKYFMYTTIFLYVYLYVVCIPGTHGD